MSTFLLEIGSEEVPAGFLDKMEHALQVNVEKSLKDAGLNFGNIQTMSTPRRLALIISDLAPVQMQKEETVVGPPLKIAYDKENRPTKALESFCKTNGVDINKIIIETTPKGEYVAFKKLLGGKEAKTLLGEILPDIISQIPFPKSMRWGENTVTYARPVRWIVALLDDQIVSFKFGPVESDRITYGHRIHGMGPFTINNPWDYFEIMEQKCNIDLDSGKRKSKIMDIANELASRHNAKIIWNSSLLDEISGLVEHPVPILGSFDPAYLEIPDEVLLTSMQSHQKSFGIRDETGRMQPYFLTVLNIDSTNPEIVKKGWERVLRARLEDARFFWKQDLNEDFQSWLNKLEHVIFIGPLGSMGDKSRRLEQFSQWLAKRYRDVPVDLAASAGKLCKADLVSHMVNEFDTLQGIMGGIYAKHFGEDEIVAMAIKEHYLPQGPESALPSTILGQLVSLADKMDTLAGCFGLGIIPTGTADPNGLRRNALGVIRILLNLDLKVSIEDLITEALSLYGSKDWKLDRGAIVKKLLEFFTGRLRNYFISQNYPPAIVDSVLAVSYKDIPDIKARLDAVEAFSKLQNNASSLQILKRIENIVKKSTTCSEDVWKEDKLIEDAEKKLAEVLNNYLPRIDSVSESGDYEQALKYLDDLKTPVDNFFDNVMVLSEDQELRNNRLNMLKNINKRYAKIAKFSLLQN